MVNDPVRICRNLTRSLPWLMDKRRRNIAKFRQPFPDIFAVGVEFLALKNGVEDAKIGGSIGARPGHPLPAYRITGRVGIDQRIPCLLYTSRCV